MLQRTTSLLLPILLVGLAGDAFAGGRGRPASPALRRAITGPVEQHTSGILIPRSPAFQAEQRKLQRFYGYRNAAKRYLKRSGARPAPAFHQQFVARAMARAETTLNRGKLSARQFEVLVLDEGAADGMNAASWAGQLLTINRDIIDMSFEIASAVNAAGSPVEVEKNLYQLALWERGNAAKPRFVVRNRKQRNRIAEGIFMGVLLHEIGHAFKHSPEVIVKDPPFYVPGQPESDANEAAESRDDEREADSISHELALAGGSPDPAAFTLFFKYANIARQISGPSRFRGVLLRDESSHPPHLERIENANRALEKAGLRNPYEPNPGGLWLPSTGKGLIVPTGAEKSLR